MAGRTYLPTLVAIMHKVCVYITRYRAVILTHLPPDSTALLDAVVTACEALIAVIDLQHND